MRLLLWFLTALAKNGFAEEMTLQTCLEQNAKLLADMTELRQTKAALESATYKHYEYRFGTDGFYKAVAFSFACVIFAALAAGLTMGLVSIDPMWMEVIVKTEEKDMSDESDKVKLKEDQAAAQKILPLINDHHRLLVTLLLLNSIANEALPLFLNVLVPSWLAVVLSVALVLIFGEILPSAVFTGTNQLKIAAQCSCIVHFVTVVLSPLAFPVAKLLDWILGKNHKGRYNFAELRAIVEIHSRISIGTEQMAVFKCHDQEGLGIITTEQQHNFTSSNAVVFTGTPSIPAKSKKLKVDETYFVKTCKALHGRDSSFTFQLYRSPERRATDVITFANGDLTSGVFKLQERDEIKIMHGVMNLTHMTAREAMTPLSKVYMLESGERLNHQVLTEIDARGHSRIPVYTHSKHNLRGFFLVKKLILVTCEDNDSSCTVGNLHLHKMTLARYDTKMLDLLNKFQEDKCHLALVTDKPDLVAEAWRTGVEIPPDVHMAGIITLEDVIEKLIQEDIQDESDAINGLVMASPQPSGYSSSICSLKEPLLSNVTQIGIP